MFTRSRWLDLVIVLVALLTAHTFGAAVHLIQAGALLQEGALLILTGAVSAVPHAKESTDNPSWEQNVTRADVPRSADATAEEEDKIGSVLPSFVLPGSKVSDVPWGGYHVEAFQLDPLGGLDCCSCASVSTVGKAAKCIKRCGYAFMRDAYDRAVVDSVHEKYLNWYDSAPQQVTLHQAIGGSVRGSREEIILPSAPVLLPRQVLYSKKVMQVVASRFPSADLAPSLEYVNMVHSMAGSDTQAWHTDSHFADGLKVSVPLVDVTDSHGPLEVMPMQGGTRCKVVRATVRRGTAVFYLHTAIHRGTANVGQVARPQLDFSFTLPKSVMQMNYIRDFSDAAKKATQKRREQLARLCQSDGLPCATVDEVKRIPLQQPLNSAHDASDDMEGDHAEQPEPSMTELEAQMRQLMGAEPPPAPVRRGVVSGRLKFRADSPLASQTPFSEAEPELAEQEL